MVDLDRPLAKHRVGERVTLADRDRRQVVAMGNIPDRVNVRHRRPREAVDGDPAIVWIDSDASLLQPEIDYIRMPADREHHLIGGNAGAVRQMRSEFLAVLVNLADRTAGENGDAFLLHLAPHMGAHVFVEAAQDVVVSIMHWHTPTSTLFANGTLDAPI